MTPSLKASILDNFQLHSLIWYTIQFVNYSSFTEQNESPNNLKEI